MPQTSRRGFPLLVLARFTQPDMVKDSITQQALATNFNPARHGRPMGVASPRDPPAMRVNDCLNPKTAGYNLVSCLLRRTRGAFKGLTPLLTPLLRVAKAATRVPFFFRVDLSSACVCCTVFVRARY